MIRWDGLILSLVKRRSARCRVNFNACSGSASHLNLPLIEHFSGPCWVYSGMWVRLALSYYYRYGRSIGMNGILVSVKEVYLAC